MKKSVSTISRRSLLFGTASVLAAPMVLKGSRAAAKSNSLTITSSGGSYQEILVKTVVNPFTEETGIKVDILPRPEMAKVKAQQLTGRVDFDVHYPTAAEAAYGSKEGFWEKLDLSMLDLKDMPIPPTSDVVVTDTYVGGIGWDPKKFGPGKHPANFVEFFDLKKFPGRRAFLNRAETTLEAALLADGVPPKDIYPLDIDRAFKALDRIKPGIASWVTQTPQTISLVQTGEVDFSYTYANRVQATNEPGGGTPLAFSFEQNLLYADPLTILKGAPNKENAMKYIAYFTRPEVLARLCDLDACVPNSKKAMSMMSDQTRKWLPKDIDSPNNLVISGAYWADNLEAVSRRFKEWALG
ncbi:ABC transporter substrate-binding protein [Bradyrhizobium diazoefficiens]|nr:ABC transporter substrate-binding protein [Bradyrhizobium diazoefficiens]QQO23711.1 ABC transporter substrate-binding protein [Bradyrhizobium diazoefficiens]